MIFFIIVTVIIFGLAIARDSSANYREPARQERKVRNLNVRPAAKRSALYKKAVVLHSFQNKYNGCLYCHK